MRSSGPLRPGSDAHRQPDERSESANSVRRTNPGRRCQACNIVLAADNTALLCGRCHRDQRDHLGTAPARQSDAFFDTDEFRAAFHSQQIGKVFRAYRNHPRHLQLLGAVWAAADLAQDHPALELGVCPLARAALAGVGGVDQLLAA